MDSEPQTQVIVEAAPTEVARARYRQWAADNPELAASIKPGDLIVDTMRMEGGKDLCRYRLVIRDDSNPRAS